MNKTKKKTKKAVAVEKEETFVLRSIPMYEEKWGTVCYWEDQHAKLWFSERAYWSRIHSRCHTPTPAMIAHAAFIEPKIEYWIQEPIYFDFGEAKKDGKIYGFVPQKEFYCSDENPAWFVIFKDIDKVAAYLRAKTGKNFCFLEE